MQSEKVKEYLNQVCNQIRWKKAQSYLRKELEDHIDDQSQAFLEEGMEPEKAIEKAIEEMGDPVVVGTQLDRTHRPKTEWSMLLLTGAALIAGLVVQVLMADKENISDIMIKNMAGSFLGLGLLCAAYFMDFSILGRFPKLLFLLFTAFIVLVLPQAVSINGMWLSGKYIPPVMLLLLYPTLYAGILYSMRQKKYLGIIISCLFLLPVASLGLFIAPSRGVMCVLTCICLLTFGVWKGWFQVKRWKGISLIYIPASLFFFSIITRSDYYTARFQQIFFPDREKGYLAYQARLVVRDAGLLGRSPHPRGIFHTFRNDYLLTDVLESYGWIPFLILVLILTAILLRALFLCGKQKSILGGLVSFGVVATIGMQAVDYITFNLGFHLVSPYTLPFISNGAWATIMNLFLMGILLSVFKSGDVCRDNLMEGTRRKIKITIAFDKQ